MVLEEFSLGDWFLGWEILFLIVFGWIAFFGAPKDDLESIAKHVGLAGVPASIYAGMLSVTCWGVVKLVG